MTIYKDGYEVVTVIVTYYNGSNPCIDESDPDLLGHIQEHSQWFPRLWQQYKAICTFVVTGNSNDNEYAGTLDYEAENGEGWAAIIESEQVPLEGLIEQAILRQQEWMKNHGNKHYPPRGLHIMTLWETGTDHIPASWVGEEEVVPYWRLLGTIDENKLPLTITPGE